MEDILSIRLYLRKGDLVSTKTVRTIKIEKVFSRHVEKDRKSVVITIKVEKLSFEKSFEVLRITGEIQGASDENVSQGSKHSVEVSPGTRFLLIKCEGQIDFSLLEEKAEQDAFVIVSIDSLTAGIGRVKGSRVEYIAEVQSNYQGKLYETKREQDSVFFDKILKIISPFFEDIKKLIITGPGPLKSTFKNYFELSSGLDKLQVVLLEGVDTSGFDGVRMALNSEGFSKVQQDSFFSKAKDAMAKILSSLYKGDGLASVSLEEIEYTCSNGATDSLLISMDYLAKSQVDEEKLVQIFSTLMKYKGSLYFLDSNTNVGIQLESIGGVAALFRYRLK
jgi:stalled ribosome rescue protein Dom34